MKFTDSEKVINRIPQTTSSYFLKHNFIVNKIIHDNIRTMNC